jgi:AcrR family transcriptional regulator
MPDVQDAILGTFLRDGYDGASLSALSVATGLGRASLYHRFPEGKRAMALAALDRVNERFGVEVIVPLLAPGTPQERVDAMLAGLDRFYDGGRRACLLERLIASADRDAFRAPLASTLGAWTDALGRVLGDDERAVDAVAAIEGALVVAALGRPAVFPRTLARLSRELLRR